MPTAFESDQVGKIQSIADYITVIEAPTTPYSSMAEKRTRPSQTLHTWQVKHYKTIGHAGVMDNQDASGFSSNPRALLECYVQKTWDKPAVSDFAEETEIAGVPRGEMAEQIADAVVAVKHAIERRCLSASDTTADDGVATPYATRGLFSWIASAAQTVKPVPADYRTPAGQLYTGTLAQFKEDNTASPYGFNDMCASSYIQRKGPHALDAFVGIHLKRKFSQLARYDDTADNKANLRFTNRQATDKEFINVIDRLVLDTGTINLHLSSFLYTTAATGADTDYTHRSGVAVDMDMCGIAFTRAPRVVRLPYAGGGYKAIVDTIFLNMMDNPLGALEWTISS